MGKKADPTCPDHALIPQYDAQQRIVDLEVAVIVDEAQLPELVHEGVYPGPGRADNFRQRLLADLRGDRLRRAFLAEVGEEKERAGQTLLARIEQLVGEVLLDAAVARQQMGHEQLAEGGLVME